MAPLESWLDIDPASDFSLANLPFGIVSTPIDALPHLGVAVGGYVLDMKQLATHPDFDTIFTELKGQKYVFASSSLNQFASLGRSVHRAVRHCLQNILSVHTTVGHVLRDNGQMRDVALFPREDVRNHLPMEIGDYTDFYAGYHHAYHVGVMFRGSSNALQLNYTHLPVGYHGRSSSIVVSGTTIRRPWGQIRPDPSGPPIVSPSRKLDIELELGCLVSRPNNMGEPVPVTNAEDYIFGYVLLNDWSARDIQSWEYVPLGPFNSKNFASTISPWVVLADALEPHRTKAIENPTPLQGYLKEADANNVFDILLEVSLTS
jgi:fumarylacetoacetase